MGTTETLQFYNSNVAFMVQLKILAMVLLYPTSDKNSLWYACLPFIIHRAPMDKPGPPVEGLFDQIASPKSSTPLTTSSPARRQVSICNDIHNCYNIDK